MRSIWRSVTQRCPMMCVVLGFLTMGACNSSDQSAQPDLSHADFREMADELIAERPKVIAVTDFKTIVDSATVLRLASGIEQLDDALSRLAVLHQIHDTASSTQLRSRVNLVAMPFRLIADRSKIWVLGGLNPSQRVWFHEFLEQRTAAAGLPHDVWSIEPSSSAATELRGVRHTPGARHDTAGTQPRR